MYSLIFQCYSCQLISVSWLLKWLVFEDTCLHSCVTCEGSSSALSQVLPSHTSVWYMKYSAGGVCVHFPEAHSDRAICCWIFVGLYEEGFILYLLWFRGWHFPFALKKNPKKNTFWINCNDVFVIFFREVIHLRLSQHYLDLFYLWSQLEKILSE